MSYHLTDVSVDHPKVVRAMRLYDEILDDTEKRNVYLTSVRAAVSAEEEGFYGNRLTQWAESMTGFVVHYSHQEHREAVRAARNRPPAGPEDGIPVGEVIAKLRGEDGAR